MAQGDPAIERREGWLAEVWRRIAAARWVLFVSALMFLVLVASQRLAPVEGLAGFVLLALAAFAGAAQDIAVQPAVASKTDRLDDESVRRFADLLAEPCLVLNRRGLVVHKNPPAIRQFPSSIVGSPIALSIRNPSLTEAMDKVRGSGVPQQIELHLHRPTETWYRVSVAPLSLPDGNGREQGELLVLTLYNLTEQKRLDALRADFIANASHEMRTPLTSLMGFIDTLLGPAARDAAARERFLGIMRSQAERMSRLIDDMLSLSRIELRQHVHPTGTVDLVGLVRRVTDGLEMQAGEAGVAINLDLPDTPLEVTGDETELFEVVENLIDNAIKYGADGGRIDVSAAVAQDRPEPAVRLAVTDYGAGIEGEHVPRLTERFYRVDAESSRKKKGTGLGLAIVKHIVNRHRGTLTIRSRVGGGTRVEVVLPR
ncbi:MAG TPA: ATP-binding protein [Devosiaceae bacterium]